uniref:PHD-type domain-containing protein n=1 Tax=Ditylenchus dipsaci TaxID=166011 RepID=A0A915E6H0_9BILA
MTQATTRILENVGFTASSQSCIHSLTSMMKNYFEEMCRSSRISANHAGREGVVFEDVNVAFKKVGVNITELHDYIREVDSFTTDFKVPLFPVAKSPVYAAEFVDLSAEPNTNGVEPASPAIPEAVLSDNSQPLEEVTRQEILPDAQPMDRPTSSAKREVRPQRAFPSFFGFEARDLGFQVKNTPQKQVPKEDRHQLSEHEPSTSSPIEYASKPEAGLGLEESAVVKSLQKSEISALQAIFADYSKNDEMALETNVIDTTPSESIQPVCPVKQELQKAVEQRPTHPNTSESGAKPGDTILEVAELGAPESSNEILPKILDLKEDPENPPCRSPISVLSPEPASPQAVITTPDTAEDTSHHKKKKSKKIKGIKTKDRDKESKKEKKAKKRSRHDDDNEDTRKEAKKQNLKKLLNQKNIKCHSYYLPRPSTPPTNNSIAASPVRPPPTSINSPVAQVDHEEQACSSASVTLPSKSHPSPSATQSNIEKKALRQSTPPDNTLTTNTSMACATTSMPITTLKFGRKDLDGKEDKPKEKRKPGPKRKLHQQQNEVRLQMKLLIIQSIQEVRRSESAMERPSKSADRTPLLPSFYCLTRKKRSRRQLECLQVYLRKDPKQGWRPESHPNSRIFGKDVKKSKLEEPKIEKSVSRPVSALSTVNAASSKLPIDTNKSVQSTPKQSTGRKQSKPKKLSPDHIVQEEPSTTPKTAAIAKKKKHLDTEINRIFNTDTKIQTPATKSSNSKPATAAVPTTAKEAVETEEETDNVWICPVCSVAYVDGASDMVGCDGCNEWFHWHCVGILIAPPENKQWYCPSCSKKRKKMGELPAPKKKSNTPGTKSQSKKK